MFRVVTLCTIACSAVGAQAEVVRVEVETREAVLDGKPLGEAGPYEKLTGRIFFAFDPDNPINGRIVDLRYAPQNPDGLVEAWADFMVLQPADLARSRRLALVELSNRGRKASLRYFNRASRAPRSDPVDPDHFGDGLLMRLGLTVIWVGWQFDVPRRPDLLRLHVPIVTDEGRPITGLVRSDWVVDAPVKTLALGHRDHVAYPVVEPRGAP